MPAPQVGQWYSIDITELYKAWQAGTYPNYGVQLRPVSTDNKWAHFYSANYTADPLLRPRLVIEEGATFVGKSEVSPNKIAPMKPEIVRAPEAPKPAAAGR